MNRLPKNANPKPKKNNITASTYIASVNIDPFFYINITTNSNITK